MIICIEDGDDGKGEMMALGRKSGFKVIPLGKGDAVAFQASDMVAWKSRIAVQNMRSMETREDWEEISRSLESIAPIVHNNTVYDDDALRGLCVKAGTTSRDHTGAA